MTASCFKLLGACKNEKVQNLNKIDINKIYPVDAKSNNSGLFINLQD